jgi:hypothetical protein
MPGVRVENAGYVAASPSHPSRSGSMGPLTGGDVMRREAMGRGPHWQGRDAGVEALDHDEGRRWGRPVEWGAGPGSGPSESGVERRGPA